MRTTVYLYPRALEIEGAAPSRIGDDPWARFLDFLNTLLSFLWPLLNPLLTVLRHPPLFQGSKYLSPQLARFSYCVGYRSVGEGFAIWCEGF